MPAVLIKITDAGSYNKKGNNKSAKDVKKLEPSHLTDGNKEWYKE